MAEQKKICPVCNGSGQDPHFKGESRFLLSWEDCPECGGMGFVFRPGDEDQKPGKNE